MKATPWRPVSRWATCKRHRAAIIVGMTVTPVPMKHDTPENKAIADANTILRVQVGSGLHGIAVPGTDDRDEMGLVIEPPGCVIGFGHTSHGVFDPDDTFEQYEYRTQLNHVRSGPGDLDYTNYSLRKWARLAAGGNPTVLLPLFAPDNEVLEIAWPGQDLRARHDLFISRSAGHRFVGYLERQRDRMENKLSQRTNRPELVEKHGFDTKFGAHAVRLGLQGVELLSTGKITLPIPVLDREFLLHIRRGDISKEAVLWSIEGYRMRLVELCETSTLPERADYPAINRWLAFVYREWWKEKGL